MTTWRMLLLPVVAAACFAASPDPEATARTLLEQGLADKSPQTRREAVIAMSLISSREKSIAMVRSMMEDKDELVRLAAIGTLTDLRDRESVPAFRKALQDEVPEVIFAVARALFLMKDPLGKETLLSIIEGETKAESNFLSSKMRDIVRQMKTPKGALLFAFRQGIGFVPLPGVGQGVSAAEALLVDADFSGRANAVLVLGRERDEASRKAVLSRLFDDDWSVRAAVVQSIAGWDIASRAKLIKPLFDDKNDKVRFRAAAAYLRLVRRRS